MKSEPVLQTSAQESLIFFPSTHDESTLRCIVRLNGTGKCQVGCIEKNDKGVFVAKHLKDLEIKGLGIIACSQRVGNRAILVSHLGETIDIVSCSLDANMEEVLPRFSITTQAKALELFSFQHGLFLLTQFHEDVRIFSLDGETLASKEVGSCKLPARRSMQQATCGPYIVLFQDFIWNSDGVFCLEKRCYTCLFNTLTQEISFEERIKVDADRFFIQQGKLHLFLDSTVTEKRSEVHVIQLPPHCKDLSSGSPMS